jgi:class 3 adenylate cyclase
VPEAPETHYAAVGDAQVAYQVVGEGPRDVLFSLAMGCHIELVWDSPSWSDFLAQLSSFSRLILFDRRGMGASDAVAFHATPTWEEAIEDMVAVLDAAGSTHATVMASQDSGHNAILLAAMRPELVDALVLHNATARWLEAEDYSIGISPEAFEAAVEFVKAGWGTLDFGRSFNPTSAEDEADLRFGAKMARAAATPRTAAAQIRYLGPRDVRQVLPLIQCPTLVLQNQTAPLLPFEQGRYLAEHIEGARLVELPGADVSIAAAWRKIADAIVEFLTGERPAIEVNRILTTVLFTDIVGSTERAASLGDERWRSLLDAHDQAVRAELRHFAGREINTTGDGFVASFDGPARAIRCAQAIAGATTAIGVTVRTGLHTGECEVRGDDLGGVAVHIAARVAAKATPGEVFVSRTVVDLVAGSGIEFEDRGEHELKGVPGTWKLFAARS